MLMGAYRTIGRRLHIGTRAHGRYTRVERDGAVIVHRGVRRVATLLVMLTAFLAVVQVTVAQAEPMPAGISGTWALRVNEEFTGAGLNTALWTPGWQSDASISGPMSNECVASKNVYQPGNGYLYLQVRKEHATCGTTTVENTGGLIESNPSDGQPGHSGFAYTYGVVEWEAYVPGVSPEGRGCPKGGCLPDWPALWSLSNTNADEIDNMEGLETLGKACYHIHPPPGSEGPGSCLSGSYASAWHKYASEWEPGVVKFFYDGSQVGELSSEVLNGTPQYLIADMTPPGCCNQPLVVPDEMVINYVRVWQHPSPPSVSTGAATEAAIESAKLHGEVNPNTFETHYYFEYGPTTSYGQRTPEEGAGSGSNPVPATATITGLIPITTYHYRLVASNTSGQTSYGEDRTFTTPTVNSSPAVVREGTNYTAVFNRNGAGGLSYWSYSSSGGWENKTLGGEVAAGSSPSVVHESNGYTAAYYVSKTGGIDYWAYSSGKWTDIGLGSEVAAGTSPYGLREGGSYNAVFYVNKKGELAYWSYGSSGWENTTLGGEVAAGTSPSVVHESNGYTAAYYVSKTGGIDYWAYSSGVPPVRWTRLIMRPLLLLVDVVCV